jgi:nicotinate-nucleotide adenylyltransferase
MRKKIGIYPGTFDPVHEGHIAFALTAKEALGLNEVVFLPEANPRNKPGASSLHHRLAMLTHAIKPYTGFSSLVINEPRFTVSTTLPLLQNAYPHGRLVLLMGSDVALTLPYWPEVSELLDAMDIVVGMRANESPAELDDMFKKLSLVTSQPLSPSYITADQASLCSTDIRAGKITHSHTAIASYITANNLYTK